jgi:hypothetical protein
MACSDLSVTHQRSNVSHGIYNGGCVILWFINTSTLSVRTLDQWPNQRLQLDYFVLWQFDHGQHMHAGKSHNKESCNSVHRQKYMTNLTNQITK